uniref:Uncharacterized protein n=1 Tax=Anguilla anguilla TaxID=7936 RepID=A0A0E9X1Q1_ANGAN
MRFCHSYHQIPCNYRYDRDLDSLCPFHICVMQISVHHLFPQENTNLKPSETIKLKKNVWLTCKGQ